MKHLPSVCSIIKNKVAFEMALISLWDCSFSENDWMNNRISEFKESDEWFKESDECKWSYFFQYSSVSFLNKQCEFKNKTTKDINKLMTKYFVKLCLSFTAFADLFFSWCSNNECLWCFLFYNQRIYTHQASVHLKLSLHNHPNFSNH